MKNKKFKTILEEGKILTVTSGTARIALLPGHDKDQCKKCGACMPIVKGGALVLDAQALPGMKENDRVVVEVTLPASPLGTLTLFAFVLLFFVLGGVLGNLLGVHWNAPPSLTELCTLGGAILFLCFAFFILYLQNRRWRKKNMPRIVEKLEEG